MWTIDIKPIPDIRPVINLREFVLSLSKYACVNPSITVGIIRIIEKRKLIYINLKRKKGIDRYPK
tara:strand:+ start:177 stop:371 length:195 start_codon:yes stop_codon:yes gene_type:complete